MNSCRWLCNELYNTVDVNKWTQSLLKRYNSNLQLRNFILRLREFCTFIETMTCLRNTCIMLSVNKLLLQEY